MSKELHQRAIVVDTHCDTVHKFGSVGYDFSSLNNNSHVDLPRLQAGGVDVQFFALFIEPQFKPVGALRQALQLADRFFREMEANSDKVDIVPGMKSLHKSLSRGHLAAVLSIEGGEALEGDLGVLRMFHRMGVSSIGLTWNQRNRIADGIGELKAEGGLTGFGREVVREMNRLGMLVDLAHITPRGFYDVLELSSHPVIVSHGNCKTVCDHPRNLDDNQMKALAEAGGVLGLTFCPPFVDGDKDKQTLERLVDHAVHGAEVMGVEHLGIGSDYDGIEKGVKGLEDVSRLPALTDTLIKRGFSPIEVEKILGQNYLRVFEQVWPQ